MTGLDWIIITVYLICVASVLLRAFSSLLVAQISIVLNDRLLARQLQEQNINFIDVKFRLANQYDVDQLKELDLIIYNQSDNMTVYIDWDYCCLIDVEGRSYRVVRLPPGTTFDLLPSQIVSAIPPGQTLQQKLTAESSLKRESETSPLKPIAPVVNLSRLKPYPKSKLAPDAQLPTLNFYLRLALRTTPRSTDLTNANLYILNCEFLASKLPWTENIPWRKKKKYLEIK